MCKLYFIKLNIQIISILFPSILLFKFYFYKFCYNFPLVSSRIQSFVVYKKCFFLFKRKLYKEVFRTWKSGKKIVKISKNILYKDTSFLMFNQQKVSIEKQIKNRQVRSILAVSKSFNRYFLNGRIISPDKIWPQTYLSIWFIWILTQ